eukprot:Nk52_evm2s268 gene=Nk52_evmTU2s268
MGRTPSPLYDRGGGGTGGDYKDHQQNEDYNNNKQAESPSRRSSAHSLYRPGSRGSNISGGDYKPRTPGSANRVLIVSSVIKSLNILEGSSCGDVYVYVYDNDQPVGGVVRKLKQRLQGHHVKSVGLVVGGEPGGVALTFEKFCSVETLRKDKEIREFWMSLAELLVEEENAINEVDGGSARIDIFANPVCNSKSGVDMIASVQAFTGVRIFVSNDIIGNEVKFWGTSRSSQTPSSPSQNIGEQYFNVEKVKSWSLAGAGIEKFEKIRVVGKGAFGKAVLYRKREDDSLVILKEINLGELKPGERAASLNEVHVLALLDHPNIISYYDSFEEEGTLMIEMEYADGGTLAQYLEVLDQDMAETEVLVMLRQMVEALQHIHMNSIMHRDLKTANVFLTKEGVVKLGDFGIAKLMTETCANTVLGTPYYISPELCEGKPYNQKSDVWALGCILYEMVNRKRAFEGSNLPAVVTKIMKGEYDPIKEKYSMKMRQLVSMLLNTDPALRPDVDEILDYINSMSRNLGVLPAEGMDSIDSLEDDEYSNNNMVNPGAIRAVFTWGKSVLKPELMDALFDKVFIKELAIGQYHSLALTSEGLVYGWGQNSKGQLGMGHTRLVKTPSVIEELSGKNIAKIGCGSDYSVFVTSKGMLMTCGSNDAYCLGHSSEMIQECLTPRLVETLVHKEVVSVSCGPRHVVALTSDNEIYSWGNGDDGKLGLGSQESFYFPQKVNIMGNIIIMVKCGQDGTLFLTRRGRVLACGNNADNKLGLKSKFGFLTQKRQLSNREVFGCLTPAPVKAFNKYKVVKIQCGRSHSAVITDKGKLFVFGSNKDGQLGDGTYKLRENPIVPKGFVDKMVTHVCCGANFTVALCSKTMSVYTWGKGKDGRLGNGEETNCPTPTQIQFPLPLDAVHCIATGNTEVGIVGDIKVDIVTNADGQKSIALSDAYKKRLGISSNLEKTLLCNSPFERNVNNSSPMLHKNNSSSNNSNSNSNNNNNVDGYRTSTPMAKVDEKEKGEEEEENDNNNGINNGNKGNNVNNANVQNSNAINNENSNNSGSEGDLPPWLVEELEEAAIPISPRTRSRNKEKAVAAANASATTKKKSKKKRISSPTKIDLDSTASNSSINDEVKKTSAKKRAKSNSDFRKEAQALKQSQNQQQEAMMAQFEKSNQRHSRLKRDMDLLKTETLKAQEELKEIATKQEQTMGQRLKETESKIKQEMDMMKSVLEKQNDLLQQSQDVIKSLQKQISSSSSPSSSLKKGNKIAPHDQDQNQKNKKSSTCTIL